MIQAIKKLYLEVTTKCNLNCSYCYNCSLVRNKEVNLAEKLEWFFRKFSSIISADLLVTLHGGEPLLDCESAKKIYSTITEWVPGAAINIQTNGTTLHLPEVQAFLFGIENKFLSVGFDSKEKNPRNLDKWTMNYLRNVSKVDCNYVISDAEDIKNLAGNLNYIYHSYGFHPHINYNFLNSYQLQTVYPEIVMQLRKTDYHLRQTNVELSVEECGEVTLQSDGVFRGCEHKIYTSTTFTDALHFQTQNCSACEYKKYCIACPVRIANYQGNLCFLTKALVEGAKTVAK
jgi:MoaA/NifB/PqqE/SkfB family radical SAM enzyme